MKIRTDIGKKKLGMEIEDHVFSVTEKDVSRIEMPLGKKKVEIFWWLIVSVIIIIFVKVFYLNFIKGNYYKDIAKGNSIRYVIIKAPRGKIYDRKGTVLVNNFPSMDAVMIPADIPRDENDRRELVKKLEKIFGINSGEIVAKFELSDKKSFNAILLKEGISQDEALMLEEQKNSIRGIMIEKTSIRDYVDSSIFSHILGYEGKIDKSEMEKNSEYLLTDYIGKQGLEKFYEKYLRGVHGTIQVEVDSMGNIKKQRGTIEPKAGNDLVLNIDSELQKKVFDTLLAFLEKTQTKKAAAVIIDPRNGGVRALVSLPSFDNNLFSKKISKENYLNLINDKDRPFFNRAVSGEYPPGSTLKMAVAAGALAEGIISENTSIECSGGISIGNYFFGDWKNHGHNIDIKKAIAESCDVFFYSIGGGYGNIDGLGMSRMKQYENAFGFGELTGIDIPNEAKGFIPDEQWKLEKFKEKWYVGNSYHASIGQGYILSTPLQLANYTAAIANGGTLMKPIIVDYIKNGDNLVAQNKSEILKDALISPAILKIIRDGMRQTVTSGTAQQLKDLPVPVAGKTGTAQFGTEDNIHSWLVSFAPFDNPELAMVVLMEGLGDGHSTAVPATKEIYEWYFKNKDKY